MHVTNENKADAQSVDSISNTARQAGVQYADQIHHVERQAGVQHARIIHHVDSGVKELLGCASEWMEWEGTESERGISIHGRTELINDAVWTGRVACDELVDLNDVLRKIIFVKGVWALVGRLLARDTISAPEHTDLALELSRVYASVPRGLIPGSSEVSDDNTIWLETVEGLEVVNLEEAMETGLLMKLAVADIRHLAELPDPSVEYEERGVEPKEIFGRTLAGFIPMLPAAFIIMDWLSIKRNCNRCVRLRRTTKLLKLTKDCARCTFLVFVSSILSTAIVFCSLYHAGKSGDGLYGKTLGALALTYGSVGKAMSSVIGPLGERALALAAYKNVSTGNVISTIVEMTTGQTFSILFVALGFLPVVLELPNTKYILCPLTAFYIIRNAVDLMKLSGVSTIVKLKLRMLDGTKISPKAKVLQSMFNNLTNEWKEALKNCLRYSGTLASILGNGNDQPVNHRYTYFCVGETELRKMLPMHIPEFVDALGDDEPVDRRICLELSFENVNNIEWLESKLELDSWADNIASAMSVFVGDNRNQSLSRYQKENSYRWQERKIFYVDDDSGDILVTDRCIVVKECSVKEQDIVRLPWSSSPTAAAKIESHVDLCNSYHQHVNHVIELNSNCQIVRADRFHLPDSRLDNCLNPLKHLQGEPQLVAKVNCQSLTVGYPLYGKLYLFGTTIRKEK